MSEQDWQRIVEALAYYAKHCEKPKQPVITVLSLGDLSARDITQAAGDPEHKAHRFIKKLYTASIVDGTTSIDKVVAAFIR